MNNTYIEGFFCLKFESKLAIISLQVTNNKILHMSQSPLLPGEIHRHLLLKNE